MGLAAIVNGEIRDRLQDIKEMPNSYMKIAGGFRLQLAPEGIVLFHQDRPQEKAVVGTLSWSNNLGNRWNLNPEWRIAVRDLIQRLDIEEVETEEVPF